MDDRENLVDGCLGTLFLASGVLAVAAVTLSVAALAVWLVYRVVSRGGGP